MIKINEVNDNNKVYDKTYNEYIKLIKKANTKTKLNNLLDYVKKEMLLTRESKYHLNQLIIDKLSKLSKVNEAAKDAIVLDNNSKEIVASQVALNIQGEWDAIDGYMKLIPFLRKYNDTDSIKDIEEIISDEKNHAKLLRDILLKYDGNIQPKKD